MKRKLLVVVALFVIGFGAIGYVLLAPQAGAAAATSYLTSTATTTDVIQEAATTGTVAASTTYGLGFGRAAATVASGGTSSGAQTDLTWTVDTVDVAVGDRVAAGDTLATATSDQAQVALQEAQVALATAQQTLDDAVATPTADDRAAADSDLTKAQMSLDAAKRSLDETKASNAASLASARTSVNDAELNLSTDEDDDAASSILRQDRRSLRDARRSLESTRRDNASKLADAEASVTSAELAFADAQRTYEDAIAPTDEATLDSYRTAVTSAQQALDAAQDAADASSIVAPADGIVTTVDLVVGATAPAGDAIAMEAGPMIVTASFTESDLTSLASGLPATVTIDAVDAELTGSLTSIDPVASSSGSSSVVSYPATITLQDAPDTLRTGMSAEVAVTIASEEDVVAVPVASLVGRGGTYQVRTLASDGSEQLVPVEVGLVTDTMAAITSGITDGTTVITGTASDQASSGTTTTQSGFGGLGGLGGLSGGGGFPGGGQRPTGGGNR